MQNFGNQKLDAYIIRLVCDGDASKGPVCVACRDWFTLEQMQTMYEMKLARVEELKA